MLIRILCYKLRQSISVVFFSFSRSEAARMLNLEAEMELEVAISTLKFCATQVDPRCLRICSILHKKTIELSDNQISAATLSDHLKSFCAFVKNSEQLR